MVCKSKSVHINFRFALQLAPTSKSFYPYLLICTFEAQAGWKNVSNLLTDPSLLSELVRLENLLKTQMSEIFFPPWF